MSNQKNTINSGKKPHNHPRKRQTQKTPMQSKKDRLRKKRINNKARNYSPNPQKQLPQRYKPAQLPSKTEYSKKHNSQLASVNSQKKPSEKKPTKKPNNKNNHNLNYKANPKKNSRKNKEINKKTNKEIAKKTRLDSTHLLPILDYIDKGYSGFLLKNNIYMNLFRIHNHDYVNKSENETKLDIAYWERVYRAIAPANFKILITNMPNNITECKDYLKRESKKVTDLTYIQLLKEEIAELERLESGEYKQPYLFIYLNKYEDLINYNAEVVRNLCETGLAQEIEVSEKLMILNKLCCPHTYDSLKHFENLI